mmetsp:Transcript_2130/g.4473  ORF Transcript_2130/g.4473 Transcript_2130/m.4473 type:complete len:82 (+) Transcript_2130:647-892(+)
MKKPAMVAGFGMSKSGVIDRRVPCIVGNAVSWSKTTIICMFTIFVSCMPFFVVPERSFGCVGCICLDRALAHKYDRVFFST